MLASLTTHPSSKAHRGTLKSLAVMLTGWLPAVLVVGIAILFVSLAAVSRTASGSDFQLLGHPVLVVLSGSMTPVIDTGDLVIDRPDRGATNLHAGQIMSFYDSPGSPMVLTHRIIDVIHRHGRVFYRTKGDANPAADPVLRPASDVIGVFQWRIPRGGYVLANIHKPYVLGLLLAAPLLWFLSGTLRSWAEREDAGTDGHCKDSISSSPGGDPEHASLETGEGGRCMPK